MKLALLLNMGEEKNDMPSHQFFFVMVCHTMYAQVKWQLQNLKRAHCGLLQHSSRFLSLYALCNIGSFLKNCIDIYGITLTL